MIPSACRNCKFYERGDCRRYPPVLMASGAALQADAWVFPQVTGDNWCGEFDERKEVYRGVEPWSECEGE